MPKWRSYRRRKPYDREGGGIALPCRFELKFWDKNGADKMKDELRTLFIETNCIETLTEK